MAQKVKGLTIEIGGETKDLTKALEKCRGETKSLQNELNFVNKGLKLDPTNVELVTQKKTLLKEAIAKTKETLDTCKLAQSQMDQMMQEGVEIDQKQYRFLQREIAFTEERIKQYREELVNVQLDLATVAENIDKFGHSAEDMGKKLLGVSTAVGALGLASGKMASDYEDSIAKVSTIADATQVSMEEMASAITDLSNETGVASKEIAENVYDAISAGQKTGDAVSFVRNATTLARAGFAETGDTLDILTTIMNAYGLEAEEVGNVSDMLIQTQNLGKTTVAELSAAMGKVIPTANSQNIALDQLCASYAVMTSNGIATAETTTYLNSMLNELGKQGTSAYNTFAKGTSHIKEGGLTMAEAVEQGWTLTDVLGVLGEEAQANGTSISNMFGSAEAGKAATVLWNNADKVNEAITQMGNSSGATQEAFDKLDTTSYQTSLIINQVKNTMIELGQTILTMVAPVIESLSKKVKEFSNWFTNLDDKSKRMIVTLGAFVVALAPMLIGIGKVSQGLSSIIGLGSKVATQLALMSAKTSLMGISLATICLPIIAVVAAIGTLIGAFVHLWKTNETFRNNIIAIWDSIKAKFEEFGQGIVDRLNAIGFDFQSFSDVIKTIWESFCNFLAPVFEGVFSQISNIISFALDLITGVLDIFIGFFTGNWDQLWLGVQEIFGAAWNFLISTFQNCIAVFRNIADVVLGWFGTSWNQLWTNVGSFFTNCWNNIVSFFSGIGTSLVTLATNFWNNIVSFFTEGIPSFVESIISWLQQLPYYMGFMIGTILGNVLQFGADLVAWIATNVPLFIGNIITFMSQLPGKIWTCLLNALAKVIEWHKNMIAKALEIGTNFVDTVITFFSQLPGKIWTWLVQVVNQIIIWKNELIAKGKDAINGMITSIVETAQSIPGKMLEIGKNIVNGVWQGICNAKDAFFENVKGFFSGIVDGVKGTLKIQSPSRVFEKEVGEWIPPGVSQGINKTAGVVKNAIGNMIDGAISTARSALKSLPSIGGITIGATALPGVGDTSTVNNVINNNNVTINAETVDKDHIDEIVDEINRKLGDKL